MRNWSAIARQKQKNLLLVSEVSIIQRKSPYGGARMIKRFDHVTLVVTDIEKAKHFLGLLGFEEALRVVISGDKFADYMGIEGIEAEHVTLVLANAAPRVEVQLRKYRHPDPVSDPNITNLCRLGFNHICFEVDDLKASVEKFKAAGITILNEIMDFHDRKLVFIEGPERVTLELSEWY
jgi:catechol 2,3-dioxygenase-like lactoylglutathione lyase family enzyme